MIHLQMSSTNQQKKKQDERNSKLVRELAALPANKYCFECGQRGPTYVNITNGSFCCMHCSGILRGLNPPHRVKSISMATFSNEEIEKLKSMGNEENAKIWLGLHDGPVKFEPVRLDETVKQHLIQKYERKRWYVSPSEIAEQRRLLEAHTRRDSSSAISINSHKSNQSAPANLQPERKNDLMDILGEDLMFPVKEEPANTTPTVFSSSAFSNHSTVAPSQFPPLSFPTMTPLAAHSNTPQPLQFDLFGAPAVPKVPAQSTMPPQQQHNTLGLFNISSAPASQPKIQDNFANFDAAFNNFSISDTKPLSSVPPQTTSNGFPVASLPPSQLPTVLEPVKPIQPLEPVTLEPKKDDGLPDYSALEALYKAEDEPVDFFGFGKTTNTANNTSTTTLTSSAANGFAKSSTIGNFGYQSPNNFGNNPTVASTTGLTSNPFFSMNNFSQPSSGFSTTPQAPAPWLPTTNNGTATTATEPSNAQWNPFS